MAAPRAPREEAPFQSDQLNWTGIGSPSGRTDSAEKLTVAPDVMFTTGAIVAVTTGVDVSLAGNTSTRIPSLALPCPPSETSPVAK